MFEIIFFLFRSRLKFRVRLEFVLDTPVVHLFHCSIIKLLNNFYPLDFYEID